MGAFAPRRWADLTDQSFPHPDSWWLNSPLVFAHIGIVEFSPMQQPLSLSLPLFLSPSHSLPPAQAGRAGFIYETELRKPLLLKWGYCCCKLTASRACRTSKETAFLGLFALQQKSLCFNSELRSACVQEAASGDVLSSTWSSCSGDEALSPVLLSWLKNVGVLRGEVIRTRPHSLKCNVGQNREHFLLQRGLKDSFIFLKKSSKHIAVS